MPATSAENPYKSDSQACNGPEITDIPAFLWNFLIAKGLDSITVASIMGNISWESGGFDPAAISSDGHNSLGLCQWTFERRTRLESFAATMNKPATDPRVQFDYLWIELSQDYAAVIADMRAKGDSIEKQTETFCFEFEKPQRELAHLPERIERATQIFQTQGKGIATKGSYTAKQVGHQMFGKQAPAGGVKVVSMTEDSVTLKKLPGICYAEPIYPDFITVSDKIPAWIFDMAAREKEAEAQAKASGVSADGTQYVEKDKEKVDVDLAPETAPNGEHYLESEIKALMEGEQKMTREDAVKYLAQTDKYKANAEEKSIEEKAQQAAAQEGTAPSSTKVEQAPNPYITEGVESQTKPETGTATKLPEEEKMDSSGRTGIIHTYIGATRIAQLATKAAQLYPTYGQGQILRLYQVLDRAPDRSKEDMRKSVIEKQQTSDGAPLNEATVNIYKMYFDEYDKKHETMTAYQ